jgi:phage terminase large subunit-like protein
VAATVGVEQLEIRQIDRMLDDLRQPVTDEQILLKRSLLRVKARKLKGLSFQPEPHQLPPYSRLEKKWRIWLLQGGRGSGKTRAGVEYVMKHLRELGPLSNVGVGAPTFNDAKLVCMEGPSGLYTLYPHEFTAFNRTDGVATHIRGGMYRCRSTTCISR